MSVTHHRRRGMRAWSRPLLILVLVLGALSCKPFPSVGTDFAGPGPFEVSTLQGAAHRYYYPSNLGAQGRDHPVVLWGNGTFVTPDYYDALLRHLASHGFIVAAAMTTNAGSGVEMLAGLDNLTAFNADSTSPFFEKVDLTRVATTGHSQGGGGAINAASDPRVDVTVPIQPGGGNGSGLHGPAFFLSGSADTIIPPATVRQKFTAAAGIPAAYGELAGADHFAPLGNGNGYRGPVTAWLRWHLMNDPIAADQFTGPCAYCTDDMWTVFETNDLLVAPD